jgi:outer membrane immunogenic protein
MRRFALMLLATSSLVTLTEVTSAADIAPRMATKAPAVAPIAYYNWTGCYVGGHVGWGWGKKDVSTGDIPALGAGNTFLAFGDDVDGFLGGVQAGCNYQINPNWVIGVEGQYSWANLKGDFSRDPFLTGKIGRGTFSARTDWTATLAGRVGYAWDRWMIYGKAGVAWAGDKYDIAGLRTLTPYFLNGSETRTGWMIGVGLEYAFWNNWSAKVEYDYLDFGNKAVTLTGLFAGVVAIRTNVDIDQQIHVVKVGLNYRFGDYGKGPMVARY